MSERLPEIPEPEWIEAMIAAMWPGGEIIHDDAFDGPEDQARAAYTALREQMEENDG